MRDIADLRLSNILLAVDDEGIARVTLNRPAKRNALDLATIEELIDIFTTLPRAGVRAAILDAAGDHFCAGLDLVEHHREDRSAADFMQVCLRWHDAFNRMELAACRSSPSCRGRSWAAGWNWPAPRISAWRGPAPISACPRGSVACSRAAAPRSAWPT